MISVVTPFHNSAEYLAECIESVLSQDATDFEYVLLDNCSTDGGDEIAASYAQRDGRIRLEKTGRLLPQAENYNHALRLISPTTRYCKVAQADDWLYPTCLSSMVALAESHPSIAVVSAYELQHDNVTGSFLPAEFDAIDGRSAARIYMLENGHMFGSPTTVMYRADLVRNRPDFYDVNRMHEDTEVIFELLKCGDFGFVHQVLTYSRRQTGSISDKIKDYLTQKLDQLIVVDRYGRHFLSEQEFDECWNDKYRSYYRAVARRWVRDIGRSDPAFWLHQKEALATIDRRLERRRIASELVPGLIDWVKPGQQGGSTESPRRPSDWRSGVLTQ